MASAPEAAGRPFNHALGLRTLPNLLPRVLDFYRTTARPGALGIDDAAVAGRRTAISARGPRRGPRRRARRGVRRAGFEASVRPRDQRGRRRRWMSATVFAGPGSTAADGAPGCRRASISWRHAASMSSWPRRTAERWAAGSLSTTSGSRLLRTGTVLPEARGRGLQRALIAARARSHGARLRPGRRRRRRLGSTSERNLVAMGCRRIGTREHLPLRSVRRPRPRDSPSALVPDERRCASNVPARRQCRAGHARPAGGPQRLRRRRSSTSCGGLRAAGARGADALRAVVLAGDGPSFCAGADIAWMRASLELDREGNEQDAMALAADVRRDRYVPRPGDRARPGRGARRRHGPLRGERPRHRRGRREVRLHRDAARHPARGHLAVRDRQDRRDAMRARCSPAAAASTPRGRCASAWSTRSSKGMRGARRGRGDRGRGRAGRRADRRPCRQGDHPRGPRPAPRVDALAHGPPHRDATHQRRGTGRPARVPRAPTPGVDDADRRASRMPPPRPGYPGCGASRARHPSVESTVHDAAALVAVAQTCVRPAASYGHRACAMNQSSAPRLFLGQRRDPAAGG